MRASAKVRFGWRQQLFDYVTERLGDERASVAAAALTEFADELIGGGPTA